MNKLKILILILSVWYCLIGNAQTPTISLKVSINGCGLNLKFINKTKNKILIPDLKIRRVIQNNYAVLSPEVISTRLDTLFFMLKSKNDSSPSKLIITPTPTNDTKVTFYYSDIELKRANSQIIRLPEEYCGYDFRYCRIYFDGVLLAEAKVER
jgi:hypothetical protein